MKKRISKPKFRLPGKELLGPASGNKANLGDTAKTARLLVGTLAKFNLHVEVVKIITGPVLTCYKLLPAAGTRQDRIAQLTNTLQMALNTASLRIQAPEPGTNLVSIEVPNPVGRIVTLREILRGKAWTTGTLRLPLALGKDVGGRDLIFDLAEAPHMLVAGCTGSGKSICINAILAGLLMSRSPTEMRLILIDPKRVEFTAYNDLPHLLMPVVTDSSQAAMALRWAIQEMDRRYKMLQTAKVRNIVGFNSREVDSHEAQKSAVAAGGEEAPLPTKLPYIVIVIDEIADLMITVGQEIEQSITKLAQLSRAVGIHMILATQRPSANVINGTIKANFPSRIALQVAQKTDSLTILDQQGAESLLGRGDMLFMNPSYYLIRAQGAHVSEAEILRVTNFIRSRGRPLIEPTVPPSMETMADFPVTGREPLCSTFNSYEDIAMGDHEQLRVTCVHGSQPGKGSVRIQIRDDSGRLRPGPEIPFAAIGDVVRAMTRLVQLEAKTP